MKLTPTQLEVLRRLATGEVLIQPTGLHCCLCITDAGRAALWQKAEALTKSLIEASKTPEVKP